MPCPVEGCLNRSRGICATHSRALQRANPMPWSACEARFWVKVDVRGPIPQHAPHLGPCWLWMAGRDTCGYGKFHLNGREPKAHRVAYEAMVGLIPDGLTLDHLCRVRHCVRYSHLEPVTLLENWMRSPRATTHPNEILARAIVQATRSAS